MKGVILLGLTLAIAADKSEHCEYWASVGECQKNPHYMFDSCVDSCKAHGEEIESYDERCPMDENRTAALAPGALTGIIRRALELFPELEPELVSEDPPIIVFDKFATKEEISALLHHGKNRFERSTGLGKKEDGTIGSIITTIRTSQHTWCQNACLRDPIVVHLSERVSNITMSPVENTEFAQLLRYTACPEEGHDTCQFYKRHHDYIQSDVHRQQGVRIYTLFIYLNDVEEGGLTVFDAGISVTPKAGRAVLWPSVKEAEPHQMDTRTHHEAKSVTKGIKYAANFWVHQYDFRGPYARGCSS